MANRAVPVITNFTAGELSPRLVGRIDLDRYQNGVETLENFKVFTHGGITKRSGTGYITGIKTQTGSNSGAVLVPFIFSKTQAYVLEFGHNYFRVFKDEGQVASGGSPVEITANCDWTAAQVDDLRFAQSADILYVTHPDLHPVKITRSSHTAWTVTDIPWGSDTTNFHEPPWSVLNTSTTTFTPSGTSGSVTITASANTFVSGDVGRYIRMKQTNWRFLKITGYTSATQVTATVLNNNLDATSATSDWRLSAFYANNYPCHVQFFEGRLYYGNILNYPGTIWGSVTDDYDNFSVSAADGTVADDDAVTYQLAVGEVATITGMLSHKYLTLFTTAGPFNVSSGSATAGITPTSILATRETNDGAANIAPIGASKSILFVGKNKKKIREYAYNIDYDSFTTPDMTVMSEHVGYPEITQIAYSSNPDSMLWAVRSDGQLLGLTFYRDQNVIAWHRHKIGGYRKIAFAGNAADSDYQITTTADHGLETGDEVIYDANGNGSMGGLTDGETYYVYKVDADEVELANTKDQAKTRTIINVTDSDNSATHYFKLPSKVKSIAVIPGVNDSYDTLYMIVERTINGATKQYVEFLQEDFRGDEGHTISDAWFVDSGLSLSSATAVTSISGLGHLEGESVTVLADGGVVSNKTVSSSAITLTTAAREVKIGLGYTSKIKTLRLEPGGEYGTSQGKTGRIDKVTWRLHETVNLKAGPYSSMMDVIPFRTTTAPIHALKAKSGDFEMLFPGHYEKEKQIYAESSDPLPCTILSMIVHMATSLR
tara:strand:+ start:24548 stop:26863 length:2316 start_codon:yes stop_codon:yes gene_type:complete